MAIGALERFDADVAVSITGIAGPDGGSEEKPVGYVCFNARLADGTAIARDPVIPGGRAGHPRTLGAGRDAPAAHAAREARRHEVCRAETFACMARCSVRSRPRSVAGMAKERLKSPRARLFVALDLPDDGAGGDRGLGRRGAGRPGPAAGAAGVAARHPRLPRLPAGEGDRGRSPRSCGRARGRRRGSSCATRCQRPPRGRARLYALPALSPGTGGAAGGARAEAWSRSGFYKPEKRPFWPHVTVARVRPEARGSRRPAVVSEATGRTAARAVRATRLPSG